MSEKPVPISCPNCGAGLDVYSDMERFSCGYCGTAIMAERRGGTVSLKCVTEAIRKVQAGTDKTAAELALARLAKELAANKAAVQAIERRDLGTSAGCAGLVAFVAVTVLAMLVIPSSLSGLVLLVGGGLGLFVSVLVYNDAYRRREAGLEPLRSIAKEIEGKMETARKVADA
jgi:predicted RNA-binding Zn-ribbon protein involved in translation (DUF1610 family)